MTNDEIPKLPPATPETLWSERQRTVIPEGVPDYFDRPELFPRLRLTSNRLTLLKAPGGFGKTELLAACCRQLVRKGIATAWLSADEDDDQAAFAAGIALAFLTAGIGTLAPADGPDGQGDTSGSIGRLLRAIESHHAPCVLAVDELERLARPAAIDCFSSLIQRAPPNLHIAVACRELPATLNLAVPLVKGRTSVMAAEDLRFSRSEVTGYFGTRLTREQRLAIDRDCEGWPIALSIYRKANAFETPGQAQAVREILDNWIASQLWRHASPGELEFLRDLGLFERLDTDLIDTVLDGSPAQPRLLAMRDLAGIIEWEDREVSPAGRLHPLVHQHCAAHRLRNTPERYRSIHRRIALALEQRGEILAATRHATKSGEADLVGHILENAGGLRIWLRRGPPSMQEVDAMLSLEVTQRFPRLALARCGALATYGRLDEARRTYAFASEQTAGFTHNPNGNVRDLHIDDCLTRGAMNLFGCAPVDTFLPRAYAELASLADEDHFGPPTRAALNYWQCVYANLQGRFATSLEHAEQALRWIDNEGSPYLDMLIDIELGSRAMVRGEVDEAVARHAAATRTSRSIVPDRHMPPESSSALERELALERNRLDLEVQPWREVSDFFSDAGSSFGIYATTSATITELMGVAFGTDAALTALDDMTDHARNRYLPALIRYLYALRVGVLATAGRKQAAEQAWQAGGLPAYSDCHRIDGKAWRELEALACAKLSLYMAQGAFGSGRRFLHRLLRTTTDLGLKRTAMRAIALAITLEHQAGDADAAAARLVEFLHLFATTDYARPLVRQGSLGRTVLESYLASRPGNNERNLATSLLDEFDRASKMAAAIPALSMRDLQVLRRLENHADEQIAAQLDTSVNVVRSHISKLFVRLRVQNRQAAVKRARTIGIDQKAT